jgi:hypothetical protein
MKLMKSFAGKVFIFLYYVFLCVAGVSIMIFIVEKTGSFLAGFVASFLLSFVLGMLGGELEFREHMKTKYGKLFNKRKEEEPDNVLDFTEKP